MANYDIIGSIAILKSDGKKESEIRKQASQLLKRKDVKTVVEKIEKFKGRLRTIKTRHLAGERTLESIYKESGCFFKVNVEHCYFSSRLANERLEIAKKIKKNESVLVMFSGIAPYPIIIAKHSKAGKIVAIELGKESNKFARQNLKLNQLEGKIELIQGDVKKAVLKLKQKFDVIVMPRPKLKDSFLKSALRVSKRGTRIFYYAFGKKEELEKIGDDLKKEAKGKIKIVKIVPAGEIAPYKFRWRVEIKVL